MITRYNEVALGEIATPIFRPIQVVPGQPYRTIGVKWWGEGAYERQTIDGSQTAAKMLSLVQEGDLIINKIWVRHGSIAIATSAVDGCAASGEFPTFSLDLKRVVPRWIHWQTKARSFWEKCDALSRGTSGKNRIKPELFLTVRIPVPCLEEQIRVVTRIEELFARIHKARTLRKEAQEETEGCFDTAVAKVIRSAETYPQYQLGTLCAKIGSGSTPSGGRSAYPSSGIPFIRSMNVRMRSFSWENIAYISAETHRQMAGTHVQSNDVLLNITGASIGRVTCAPPELKESNVNQHVAIIRPRAALMPRYLMYWLSQPSIQELINAEQKGATRQGFTKRQIESLRIALPPVPEQQRIADRLDNLQTGIKTLRAVQAETTSELDALMPSILDKAFRGELLNESKLSSAVSSIA